jgi:carbon starvation protein
VTGVPLVWDVAVTFTAGWQKIFSGNPKIGFFAQREAYADAIDAGKLLPGATNMDDMHTIVLNNTVDGVIMAIFLLLVLIVLVNCAAVCVRALRATEPLPTTEAPYVESRIDLPAQRSDDTLVGAGS